MKTKVERRRTLRALAYLFIAFTLSSTAVFGQTPLTVDPAEGTIGSQITIEGEGFGAKKPRVLVGTAALKVETWSATSIQGTLTKALPPMAYPVVVVVKDAREAPPISAFTVKVPEISTKDPAGAVNQEVTLTGKYFGTKKGQVQFEVGESLVSGKVTYWYMDPKNGTSELRFTVPKGLGVGAYTVRVANRVGVGRVLFAVLTTLPSEIRGRVRINGWTGDASQIKIQAVPMGVKSSDGREFTPDPRATVQDGELARTTDPHLFLFSIVGLQPTTPYRLGIAVDPDSAIKVFWRGSLGGLAMSGGPAVSIEGFAARTEVEILDSQRDWVGADDLQFTDPAAAVRSLRWKSTVPRVVGGELQISTRRFPIRGEFGPCDEPEGGIVHREQFPTQDGEWQEIGSLDFRQILTPGRTSPPPDERPAGDTAISASSTDVSAISDADLQMLLIGAPVYVRVVPITDRGLACDIKEDGVHGWVVMAKLPTGFEVPDPPPEPPVIEPWIQSYTPPHVPPWTDGQMHPNLGGDNAYVVIKEHTLPPCKPCVGKEFFKYASEDPLGYALVAMGMFAPGTKLVKDDVFSFVPGYSSSSDGFLDTFGDVMTGLATGITGFAGDFVTWLAEVSESVKDGVAKVVADVVTELPVIGDACNAVASCEDVIKAGINYGLTSMGIPPSLPNWNELKDQGMDYLASEIASEIASQTGLPEEVTKLGVDEAMTLAKGMAQDTINAMTANQGAGNGPQYDWVLPYMGMDPAVWTINVKRNGTDPLPSNLYIRTMTNGLYIQGAVHVPKVFPSNNELRIPIVLQPDYSAIPAPLCQYKFGETTCTPHEWLNKPLCQTWVYSSGVYEWQTQDCKYWGNRVDVYYRDFWVNNNLNSGTCVTLWGASYTDTDGLWLPYYPPFSAFARVRPTLPAPFWIGSFYWYPGCD